MTITITWHLVLVIVISIILLISIFREQEGGLDLSAFFYGTILLIVWLIYGGIFFW